MKFIGKYLSEEILLTREYTYIHNIQFNKHNEANTIYLCPAFIRTLYQRSSKKTKNVDI